MLNLNIYSEYVVTRHNGSEDGTSIGEIYMIHWNLTYPELEYSEFMATYAELEYSEFMAIHCNESQSGTSVGKMYVIQWNLS